MLSISSKKPAKLLLPLFLLFIIGAA